MKSKSCNKIFVLYSDSFLRNSIFYGDLRNNFEIYYIYDYEKIKALVEYHPGSIIVLNLLKNDLDWLPEEICKELRKLPDETRPKIIGLYDESAAVHPNCTKAIRYRDNNEELKDELRSVFTDLGGKGRRSFVRYGGSDENIAPIKIKTGSVETTGIVHDMSAAGLSCSLSSSLEIRGGEAVRVGLSLGDKTIELDSFKILDRHFSDSIVHVLKFKTELPAGIQSEILDFIYESLNSKMEVFIKKLSN